ncbi:hypothetical protein N9C15_00905 [Schleiferiaceae bacterium]|nr:hypothetical protein [Schleiferiaceae bacterium]
MKKSNSFSAGAYKKIITSALDMGYVFMTVKEFLENGCPKEKVFILRHDFDKKPQNCDIFINVERELGVRSTTYVRVANNEYNPFSYIVYPKLKKAEEEGFEFGLHSNFLEYAKFTGMRTEDVLTREWKALSAFFNIEGIACHRDINYTYNSLPWIEENSSFINDIGIKYQAYDEKLMSSVLYVNEGLNPHLCWRTITPEEAISTGKSICLLTHNHWWYYDFPFEE